jgi:sterol desaturase/sphingolipid hydroxylase (fatty acid hydroxylase superfamily)
MLSEQARLVILISGCAFLWSIESVFPLYRYPGCRFRRALPNIALAFILVLTNLALSFFTAVISGFTVRNGFGLFLRFSFPAWLLALLGIVALDSFTYFAHVLLHKSWLGWQFHRVHHSDKEVNVTTAFRQHPGETIWRILWHMLAVAIFGLPLWVIIVYLTLSTLNAQLEHANIRLSARVDQLLRLMFVTPDMHKVHHSREQFETDTNYSNIFSVWDRLFETYTSTIDFSSLRYGLDGFDDEKKQTLPSLLKLPFVKM